MQIGSIIDGIEIAAGINRQTAGIAADYFARTGVKPSLAVVLIGENPASQVYVKNKIRNAERVGVASIQHRLPDDTSEAALLDLIARLNTDATVHGILVQLPLPPQIDPDAVIAAILPAKDVDGFHPINAGLLSIGKPGFVPCTPLGCLHLIKSVRQDLSGLHAVVIGRSNIVGKPMAHLLLGENCTVTIAHSKTRDLPELSASADILVAAIGRPELVTAEWIKPGAIVIDVGINRVPSTGGKTKLVGDVSFDGAMPIACAITPVPGGVGPMTVAFLMVNACRAAYKQSGMPWSGMPWSLMSWSGMSGISRPGISWPGGS